MKKKVENLNLSFVGRRAEEEKRYYVDEHIFIAMNAKDFGLKHLRTGQLYRVEEGRVMLVTAGWVRVIINLEEHVISRQTLLVLVPDSIFEITEWSADFDMQAFTFKDLPIFAPADWQTCLVLDDDEWLLVKEYIWLIWHQVQRQPLLLESVIHLQTALLLELKRMATRKESQWQQSASRQEKIFHQFLHLISLHGLKERKIAFYADKLCITPNHLGAVIRQVSGLTVMQWINRHTVQKAKVLLRYSDLPVWEVAERMDFANPSFFAKFFKRETGLTPKEFRKEKAVMTTPPQSVADDDPLK